MQYLNPFPFPDCQWPLRALLRATRSAQGPKECGVCDRPEWLNERTEDHAGDTVSTTPPLASTPSTAAHLSVSIAQTRKALTAILNDLHKEDHFALITFDSSILTWKDTLVKATQKNISNAISYVKGINDRGGQWKAFC